MTRPDDVSHEHPEDPADAHVRLLVLRGDEFYLYRPRLVGDDVPEREPVHVKRGSQAPLFPGCPWTVRCVTARLMCTPGPMRPGTHPTPTMELDDVGWVAWYGTLPVRGRQHRCVALVGTEAFLRGVPSDVRGIALQLFGTGWADERPPGGTSPGPWRYVTHVDGHESPSIYRDLWDDDGGSGGETCVEFAGEPDPELVADMVKLMNARDGHSPRHEEVTRESDWPENQSQTPEERMAGLARVVALAEPDVGGEKTTAEYERLGTKWREALRAARLPGERETMVAVLDALGSHDDRHDDPDEFTSDELWGVFTQVTARFQDFVGSSRDDGPETRVAGRRARMVRVVTRDLLDFLGAGVPRGVRVTCVRLDVMADVLELVIEHADFSPATAETTWLEYAVAGGDTSESKHDRGRVWQDWHPDSSSGLGTPVRGFVDVDAVLELVGISRDVFRDVHEAGARYLQPELGWKIGRTHVVLALDVLCLGGLARRLEVDKCLRCDTLLTDEDPDEGGECTICGEVTERTNAVVYQLVDAGAGVGVAVPETTIKSMWHGPDEHGEHPVSFSIGRFEPPTQMGWVRIVTPSPDEDTSTDRILHLDGHWQSGHLVPDVGQGVRELDSKIVGEGEQVWGKEMAAGTLVQTMQVTDRLWDDIKAGRITQMSIGGRMENQLVEDARVAKLRLWLDAWEIRLEVHGTGVTWDLANANERSEGDPDHARWTSVEHPGWSMEVSADVSDLLIRESRTPTSTKTRCRVLANALRECADQLEAQAPDIVGTHALREALDDEHPGRTPEERVEAMAAVSEQISRAAGTQGEAGVSVFYKALAGYFRAEGTSVLGLLDNVPGAAHPTIIRGRAEITPLLRDLADAPCAENPHNIEDAAARGVEGDCVARGLKEFERCMPCRARALAHGEGDRVSSLLRVAVATGDMRGMRVRMVRLPWDVIRDALTGREGAGGGLPPGSTVVNVVQAGGDRCAWVTVECPEFEHVTHIVPECAFEVGGRPGSLLAGEDPTREHPVADQPGNVVFASGRTVVSQDVRNLVFRDRHGGEITVEAADDVPGLTKALADRGGPTGEPGVDEGISPGLTRVAGPGDGADGPGEGASLDLTEPDQDPVDATGVYARFLRAVEIDEGRGDLVLVPERDHSHQLVGSWRGRQISLEATGGVGILRLGGPFSAVVVGEDDGAGTTLFAMWSRLFLRWLERGDPVPDTTEGPVFGVLDRAAWKRGEVTAVDSGILAGLLALGDELTQAVPVELPARCDWLAATARFWHHPVDCAISTYSSRCACDPDETGCPSCEPETHQQYCVRCDPTVNNIKYVDPGHQRKLGANWEGRPGYLS